MPEYARLDSNKLARVSTGRSWEGRLWLWSIGSDTHDCWKRLKKARRKPRKLRRSSDSAGRGLVTYMYPVFETHMSHQLARPWTQGPSLAFVIQRCEPAGTVRNLMLHPEHSISTNCAVLRTEILEQFVPSVPCRSSIETPRESVSSAGQAHLTCPWFPHLFKGRQQGLQI